MSEDVWSPPTPAELDRLLAQLDTSGECWLWTGACDQDGYGRMSYRGRNEKIHRIIWMAHEGPIPKGKVVRHDCDQPNCGWREHLRLGTQRENLQDRYNRGRYYAADGRATCGTPKLTPEQVQEIRARYVPRKVSTYQLAKEYGVDQTTIYQIVSGEKWKGLAA